MVKLAVVQGRLSPQVGEHYQHFPIHTWRNEFSHAARLGFDSIEWIISDLSNPLFDKKNIIEIADLIQEHNIQVSSISLDFLMYNPVYKIAFGEVEWLFDCISYAVQELDIRRVSIPIEENSGIRNQQDVLAVRNTLERVLSKYSNFIPKICLETDLSPKNAHSLLSSPGLEKLGLLLDLGNIAANGFSSEEFFLLLAPRIYGLHIKDRPRFFGATCTLGEGDAEISSVLLRYKELPQLEDITLQAFRTPEHFLENASQALQFVRGFLGK